MAQAGQNASGNSSELQRQLGHAHPLVTSIYAQFVDEPYAEMADRLAERATASRPSKRRTIHQKRVTHSKGD